MLQYSAGQERDDQQMPGLMLDVFWRGENFRVVVLQKKTASGHSTLVDPSSKVFLTFLTASSPFLLKCLTNINGQNIGP